MTTIAPLFLGLDFGTESVRSIVVDATGREAGSSVAGFARGQIVPGSDAARELFPYPLPPYFALQHPNDWIDSAVAAVREACVGIDADRIAGIGVDFTSCTMLPCAGDGTPLASARPNLALNPHAWPKLWKHHGAIEQTATINRIARERREPWLARYGGIVGLEWFFPKILEVVETVPDVAAATDVWLEAGDWFVWQLVGGAASELPRSTCQAGYKACWSKADGYPSGEFLGACHPDLGEIHRKLPGRFIAPGECAGRLTTAMAERLGLRAGVPVSAAIIDAHAGVPGAGVAEDGVLVMVLGTSGCHMLLGAEEKLIPGVAGVVVDGILPGHVGYETGQAAMGDAFDWVRRLTGHDDFSALDKAASAIPPGSEGLVALDWFNGCRTPLMDGSLTGAITGLTLHHSPAHVYRSVLEASAMGLRWIVETLREGTPTLRVGEVTIPDRQPDHSESGGTTSDHSESGGTIGGVPVDRFVATGGLPNHNPLFIEIVASALGAPVEVHGAAHGPALGAAILGACAADAFDSVHDAVECMAGPQSAQPESRQVQPDPTASNAYNVLYDHYRALGDQHRQES